MPHTKTDESAKRTASDALSSLAEQPSPAKRLRIIFPDTNTNQAHDATTSSQEKNTENEWFNTLTKVSLTDSSIERATRIELLLFMATLAQSPATHSPATSPITPDRNKKRADRTALSEEYASDIERELAEVKFN
jgi:hypothetical protein